MTSKTDGTNSWTLTWDDDNRLTRVQGPGGVDVSYQYDSLGRMLTRTSGGVTTKLTWDGWNCVKEDDGTNVFRWYYGQCGWQNCVDASWLRDRLRGSRE